MNLNAHSSTPANAPNTATGFIEWWDAMPFVKKRRRGMWVTPDRSKLPYPDQVDMGKKFFWDYFHFCAYLKKKGRAEGKHPCSLFLYPIMRDLSKRGFDESGDQFGSPDGYVSGFIGEAESVLLAVAVGDPVSPREGMFWTADGKLKAK